MFRAKGYGRRRMECFPAYAGMFRHSIWWYLRRRSFPRIRGDVPNAARLSEAITTFSPHTRGCSSGRPVGLVTIMRFPRIRGDVPPPASRPYRRWWFSPHTRGCSAFPYRLVHGFDVFPAYAGMFRIFCWAPPAQLGFPRIRGDVPGGMDVSQAMDAFSPHTRGCSGVSVEGEDSPSVFPAYAGMFQRQGLQ